jgi:hypothetical protein
MVVVMLVALAPAHLAVDPRRLAEQARGGRRAPVALLETARTQARHRRHEVRWEPATEGGFRFPRPCARAAAELPTKWLDADTRADIVGQPQLLLGTRTAAAAATRAAAPGQPRDRRRHDGLSPFAIVEGQQHHVAAEAQ